MFKTLIGDLFASNAQTLVNTVNTVGVMGKGVAFEFKKRFPGMYNSLDALCKRFNISLAEREKHGALIDTKLLAAVYLELQGGRERRLELAPQPVKSTQTRAEQTAYGPRPRPLAPRSTEAERIRHLEFVRGTLKDKAVWLKVGLE